MTVPIDKGGLCEERVRVYFLRLGFYAVRSVPCSFRDISITDVDIWLYSRPSPLSRHRINVDIKNKKTPQAIERIFWSLGLKDSFKLDECIVVTTDRRSDVAEFGATIGVKVLDGPFLSRLKLVPVSPEIGRLTEEEFNHCIAGDGKEEAIEGWVGRYQSSKARLLTNLDFGGVNSHLKSCIQLCENISLGTHRKEAACRLLCANLGLFLISLDFCMKDIVFKQEDERREALASGFSYGSIGRIGMDSLLQRVEGLLTKYIRGGDILGKQVKQGVFSDLQASNFTLLRDYLVKPDVSRDLFELAKKFEALAYQRSATLDLSGLGPELKSIVAIICDFSGIDRKKVL